MLAPLAPLCPFEAEHHQQRQGERQQQVEGAEHYQRGQHIDLGQLRHGGEEGHFQHPQAAGGMRQQGQGEGGEEYPEPDKLRDPYGRG